MSKPCHRGDWKDCSTTHYRIGVLVNRRMPFNHSLAEVAQHFGISRQAAYVESCVALGKLVYKLRREFPQLMSELE